MNEQAFIDEVVNEVGNQTLAKLGLNIFSLNTYNAYRESVVTTNTVSRTSQQYKNNSVESLRGYVFEDLDTGSRNILNSLKNKGQKSYTTDDLNDIQKVASIMASGKKIDNLNSKDRERFKFVEDNFFEEVNSPKFLRKINDYAIRNHSSIDTVTLDSDFNIISRSQHKVIKNIDGLFEREKVYTSSGSILRDSNGKIVYKRDDDGNFVYKYLKNNDELRMPFDDYKKHRESLENRLKTAKTLDEKELVKEALQMLNSSNLINRLVCDNPNVATATAQTVVAGTHVAQAGLSDAVMIALATLASGLIFEVRDCFKNDNVKIEVRIKRLFDKTFSSFKDTFQRGASFGFLDIGVEILTQVFRSISRKVTYLWKSIRTSFKSIFNAIWDYITGKITSYKQLITVVLKGILSAILVVSLVAFEVKLEAFLLPLIGPIAAAFLSPAFVIVIGSLAIVTAMKGVDLAINTLLDIISETNISKIKYEKTREVFEKDMPVLLQKKEELIALIKSTNKKRNEILEKSFSDIQLSNTSKDINLYISSMNKLGQLYGLEAKFHNLDEFSEFMLDDSQVLDF